MPRNRFVISTIAVSFAASSLLAQSPALDAAAQAMGGKDRLLAIRTLVLEGTGEQLSFGQNHTPYAETMFDVTSWTRSFEFPSRRWFMDMTRVPKFTTGNMNPQRQRQGLDGAPDGIAYNIGGGPPPGPGQQAPGTMSRVGGQAATERIYEFMYHPLGFLKTANIQDVTVTEEAAPGNMRRVTMSPLASPVSMVIDSRTNLPARIERPTYQAMLGDVTFVTEL